MNDRAAAGQHDAFNDVICLGQFRRLALLVPERGQERQQVARIQRRSSHRDAAGPVAIAQMVTPFGVTVLSPGIGGRAVAAGLGRQIDDDAAGLMLATMAR